MGRSSNLLPVLLPTLLVLVLLAKPSHAFGAGNIASTAKIEGQNWRHGDIEDTLLTLLMARSAGGKKFSKMDVKRTYFGNWLRDYSQAVDVGTVKMVSAEAIRILLWVLGFLSFGYGTKEFEVTSERLGCYRPEEHIDNPKDYADNVDARRYDPRLRGPVDNQRELSIDPETGLKNYIANEQAGIMTSARLIRERFGRSIQLGRQYARSNNKADLYEALRLMGTGCHCLEDYSAHSNYVELALIELGERDIFPHVGRQTMVNINGGRGPVYPIITGTFGGVDFLHSVCGEFSDKATQSEIQELEGTIGDSQNNASNTSVIRDLLSKLPSGMLGGDQAGKADELQANAQAAQMEQMSVTPRQPEAFTKQMQEISRQIYPILEWHDEIMHSINEAIEAIPVLPELIEQVQDQINMFVFSLLAPFVLPIINQVKTELSTGSTEIIQSSKDKQLIVFNDDRCSDPTHSMLSKDHFSNKLNEPAGKVASQVLKWVVPQLMAAWDDESIDPNQTITRIVNGVFHHPAMRDYGQDGAVDGRRGMFAVVQQWWSQQNDQYALRDALSRDGVLQGRNHKEGVHDTGHGCGAPIGKGKDQIQGSSGAMGGIASGLGAGALLGGLSSAFGGSEQQSSGGYQQSSSSYQQSSSGYNQSSGEYSKPSAGGSGGMGKMAGAAVGGGALGMMVGGLVGGVMGESDEDEEKKKYSSSSYNQDGSYTQSYAETGRRQDEYGGDRYGQAQYSQTTYPQGGSSQQYSQQSYGGGYERTETTFQQTGGYGQSAGESTQYYSETTTRRDSDSDSSSKKKKHHKHKKHHSDDEEEEEQQTTSYSSGGGGGFFGGGGERRTEEYDRQESSYGQSGYGQGGGGYQQEYRSETVEEDSYGGGRQEESEERQEETSYGGGGGDSYGDNSYGDSGY